MIITGDDPEYIAFVKARRQDDSPSSSTP
jgi:hypothetical protein